MFSVGLKEVALNTLHRLVARPPFSGRGALLTISKRLGRKSANVTLVSNIRLKLDLHDPYQSLIFSGDYEPYVFRLLKLTLKRGDTFVDGGANVGLHSLYVANVIGSEGHVWAFEPDPRIFPTARTNIDLNPALAARITLIEKALSSVAEELSIIQEGPSQVQSHATRVPDGNSPRVTACRVDDVVPQKVDPPVAAMKLDIEGFELEALRGAEAYLSRPNVLLFCELNEKMLRKAGASVDEVIDFLRNRKFEFRTVEGDRFDAYDPRWPEYKNAIFYRGPEAARRVDAAFSHRN